MAGLQLSGAVAVTVSSKFPLGRDRDLGPITAVAGLRKILCDRRLLEAGGGSGSRWSSSYQWLLFTSIAYEF